MHLKKPSGLFTSLALILLLAGGLAGQKAGRNFNPKRPPQARPPRVEKVIIGYYPCEKRTVVDHRQIDFHYLTYLIEAFTWPDRDGHLLVSSDFIYPELLAAAHEKGVKVIMSIGGWGNCDGFPPMATSAEKRSRFIAEVLDFCLLHGYDGVDLDWEFVSNEEEKAGFSSLVKELSVLLKAQNPPLLLTMAAPAGPYWGRWINFEELHPYFDFISFMTYDFHGPWTDHAGHNSPLYTCLNDPCGSVDDTFSYALIREIPLKKILLGIPFYGRSFETTGLYKPATNSQYYVYSEIKKLMDQIRELENQPAEVVKETSDPQLQAINVEIASLEREAARIRARIGEYQQRVENTPKAEQEMATMQRDYQITQQNYQRLLDRLYEARRAESLEKRQQGEQFRILDLAQAPRTPIKPNFLRLGLVFLVLGLGSGSGLLLMMELFDSSVKSIRQVEELSGNIPCISAVPLALTVADKDRSRRKTIALIAANVLVVVVGLVIVVSSRLAHMTIEPPFYLPF